MKGKWFSLAKTFGVLWFLSILFPPLALSQEPVAASAVTEAEETTSLTPEERPGYVTMDFKEADINTVLRLLSLKSGTNIVAGPEVKGTVTIRLENVPWEQALEVVLRTYGYVYERSGNIVRVTTHENLAQEEVITEAFTLDYTTAEEVQEAVKDMLTERGRIKIASRTNTVVISDIPTNLYKVGQVIKKLDLPTPQAFIDAKIVETQMDRGENLGIRWNPADMGISRGASRPLTFPYQVRTKDDIDRPVFPELFRPYYPRVAPGTTTVVDSFDDQNFPFTKPEDPSNRTFSFGTLDFTSFSALLSLLQSRTDTKIVSNPRIVVLNNQTAKVKVGEEVPIPSFRFNEKTATYELDKFNYRDVGIVLNVTPHINSAEEILVDLRPEISSFGALLAFTATLSAPRFNITSAQTQVLIRSGETIAIGGLQSQNTSIAEQRIPYLSSIPVVGKFFRSKRQTEGSANRNEETLFFVTVTIVDTEGQPTSGKKDKNAQRAFVPADENVGVQSVTKTPEPPLSPARPPAG